MIKQLSLILASYVAFTSLVHAKIPSNPKKKAKKVVKRICVDRPDTPGLFSRNKLFAALKAGKTGLDPKKVKRFIVNHKEICYNKKMSPVAPKGPKSNRDYFITFTLETPKGVKHTFVQCFINILRNNKVNLNCGGIISNTNKKLCFFRKGNSCNPSGPYKSSAYLKKIYRKFIANTITIPNANSIR